MNTEFISQMQRFNLAKRIYEGDKKAEKELYFELDRLEGRIKQLELKIELLLNSYENGSYLTSKIKK